eukprot:scaffold6576_cov180-Amphora_coffeaeformis.AAC.1
MTSPTAALGTPKFRAIPFLAFMRLTALWRIGYSPFFRHLYRFSSHRRRYRHHRYRRRRHRHRAPPTATLAPAPPLARPAPRRANLCSLAIFIAIGRVVATLPHFPWPRPFRYPPSLYRPCYLVFLPVPALPLTPPTTHCPNRPSPRSFNFL